MYAVFVRLTVGYVLRVFDYELTCNVALLQLQLLVHTQPNPAAFHSHSSIEGSGIRDHKCAAGQSPLRDRWGTRTRERPGWRIAHKGIDDRTA